MIQLFFDPKLSRFVRQEAGGGPLFWGAGGELVPVRRDSELQHEWSIYLKKKKEMAGPLVGILCGKRRSGGLIGSRCLFIKLQKEAQKKGGLIFLFGLDDFFQDYITGVCYLPSAEKWVKTAFPLPNIIYNRLSPREKEKDPAFYRLKEAAEQLKIPFFNPSFIDKYTLYKTLSQSGSLKSILPPTIQVNESSMLEIFLQQYKDIYLKPSQNSQGKGIMRVTREEGIIQLTSAAKSAQFNVFETFWASLQNDLQNTPYIAQKTIKSQTINNRKYDYRILSHYRKGHYDITGIGVRLASENGLTTHVPRGGSVYPYDEIYNKHTDKLLKQIVEKCGKALSKELGFFGEFTLDMCADSKNKLWLFEVNAKPMEFDEKEIEEKRIVCLAEIFQELSDFHKQ